MAYGNGAAAVLDRGAGKAWIAATAAPPIVPDWPQARAASPEPSPKLPRCPEIDCVRHLLPSSVVAFAEVRAAETGVGADRVLIAEGAITEETYVVSLAAWLGLPFEPLILRPRGRCPLPDEQLVQAAAGG